MAKVPSHRSRHIVPKSSHRKLFKQTRRSVAFESSPLVKARFVDSQSEEDGDDDDDTEESELDSLFLWDEESSLLDTLMDKPKTLAGDDPSVLALSEDLRDAFMDRGQAAKSELAHIFVSTNTEVKNSFKVLHDKVDPTIGKEILKLNTACKHAEKNCLRIAQVVEKVEAHNAECSRLEERIAASFAERDAVYAHFEEFAENTLNPVLERLKSLPARNERWMTQMYEGLKAVDKKYKKIAASKELQNYLGLV